jgi:hypothetical protein
MIVSISFSLTTMKWPPHPPLSPCLPAGRQGREGWSIYHGIGGVSGEHGRSLNLDQKVQWKISKQSLEPEGQFRPSIKPSVVGVSRIALTTDG